MTIETTIDDESGIIIQKASDHVSPDELVRSFEALLQHPKFKPEMNVVWDLRATAIKQYSLNQVTAIPEDLKQFMDRRGADYRVALVTTDAMELDLLRLYQVPLRRLNIDSRVFASLDQARQWASASEPDP